VTVTVTATPTTADAGFSFSQTFNQSVESISGISTSLTDTIIAATNPNGVTVTAGSGSFTPGETVTIEYTITPADTTGKTVDITGSVTNGQTTDLSPHSYTITNSSASTPTPTPTPTTVSVARSVSAEAVTPNDQFTITTTVNNVSGSLSLNSTYSPQVGSATIQSVTVSDAEVSPLIDTARATGSLVTLTNVGSESTSTVTVTVTETVTVGDNPGVTHRITGTLDVATRDSGSGGDGRTLKIDTKSVTVTSLEGAAGEFDADGDGEIDIGELSQAAAAFIDGDLSIGEISQVSAEFIN
jgi:hypothetical protein